MDKIADAKLLKSLISTANHVSTVDKYLDLVAALIGAANQNESVREKIQACDLTVAMLEASFEISKQLMIFYGGMLSIASHKVYEACEEELISQEKNKEGK